MCTYVWQRSETPHAHTHTSANVKSQTRGCAPVRTHTYENIKKEDEESDARVCERGVLELMASAGRIQASRARGSQHAHPSLCKISFAHACERVCEGVRECVRVSYSLMHNTHAGGTCISAAWPLSSSRLLTRSLSASLANSSACSFPTSRALSNAHDACPAPPAPDAPADRAPLSTPTTL